MTEQNIWWNKFRIDNLNKIIKIMTTEDEVKELVIQVRKAELIKKKEQVEQLKEEIIMMAHLDEIKEINNKIDEVFEVKK